MERSLREVWITYLSAGEMADLSDSVIRETLDSLIGPHQRMHTQAADILALAKTDKDAAYAKFQEEIKPLTEQVIAGLDTISNRYQQIANETSEELDRLILIMIVLNIVSALIGFILAVFYGNRSSKQISRPITAVARIRLNLTRRSSRAMRRMRSAP